MPSFQCKCGERLDVGAVPNPNEWLTISDVEYDGYSEQVDAEALYDKFKHFLKCGSCGRLWFFWNGFDARPECYEKIEQY